MLGKKGKGSVESLSYTKTDGDQEPMEEKVDKARALTVKEGRQKFETPNTSPNSSPQRSETSSHNSASSTPQPKPRTSNPKEQYPESLCPFDKSDDEEDKTLSVVGSVRNGSEEPIVPIYATVGPRTKSPEKNSGSDSGVGGQNSGRNRSASVGTEYTESWDQDKVMKNLQEELSKRHISASSIGSPPSSRESTDDSETLLLPDGSSNNIKKTNRFWPRAKYAMQQKSFMIPTVSATFITLYLVTYTALAYMQNKSMFVAFITNNPKFITVPGIIALSLFAIGLICAIKQFHNTIEHQIQEKNPNEVLKKALGHHLEDQVIKFIRLEYNNNTHSNFTFNTWKSRDGFINIDEKVTNRTTRMEAVINDRPLFTALLTGFVVANVALPLGLYAAGGMSNVTTFYQSLLATNMGLSLLVGSSVLALSVLCLGVHYYNKTNCTNLACSEEQINPKKVNEKIVGAVDGRKEDALKGNHGKEAKCSSFQITHVTAELHSGPTLSIECR